MGNLKLEDDVMLAYAPQSTALKRVTQLVTISVFTVSAVNSGTTADLPLPLKAAQQREELPATKKTRFQLFKEFLDWKRTQQQR
jgi:hypothetical protein